MTSSSVCTLARTGMNWGDIFTYRNGKLYWKVKAAAHTVIGSEAGCYDKSSGYVLVRYKRRLRRAHCIIWEMHNGPIPKGMLIDHLDRVRTNNHIGNLRLGGQDLNQKNRSKQFNNSSGITGISWDKERSKWNAKIQVGGKTINLGRFTDLDEAARVRYQAEKDYGFTPTHGK